MLFIKTVRGGLCIGITVLALLILPGSISSAEENFTTTDKPAGRDNVNLGQTESKPDRITAEYIKEYVTDTGSILVSPVKWDRNDWLEAGLIIGATSGIYFADENIRKFAQRNQSSTGDKGAAIGNAIGNPFYAGPALGLVYLYGHLSQDPKSRRASLLAAESLIISGAISVGIKHATQRPRPSSGNSSTTWDGPGFSNSDSSFPSLHAQTAFSIASVLAEVYENNSYIPPIAYGLAALTGLSRIYDNKHWASDVFFGAAIGYFIGKAVVGYHTAMSNSELYIMPAVSQKEFGITAEYRF